jgi:hypothetical protein
MITECPWYVLVISSHVFWPHPGVRLAIIRAGNVRCRSVFRERGTDDWPAPTWLTHGQVKSGALQQACSWSAQPCAGPSSSKCSAGSHSTLDASPHARGWRRCQRYNALRQHTPPSRPVVTPNNPAHPLGGSRRQAVKTQPVNSFVGMGGMGPG